MTKEATNDGGPAFPVSPEESRGKVSSIHGGLSLRDYFAAQSISSTRPGSMISDAEVLEIAKGAYRLADAMLKARAE